MRTSYLLAALAFILPALASGSVDFDNDSISARSHHANTNSGARVYVHFGHAAAHDRHALSGSGAGPSNPYSWRFRHRQFHAHQLPKGTHLRLKKVRQRAGAGAAEGVKGVVARESWDEGEGLAELD